MRASSTHGARSRSSIGTSRRIRRYGRRHRSTAGRPQGVRRVARPRSALTAFGGCRRRGCRALSSCRTLFPRCLWIEHGKACHGSADLRGQCPLAMTRVRRTETSITRHPLRNACSRSHHAGYGLVETEWADGEGGLYRAYRCCNCEATWVDQHISAEQPHAELRQSRPRLSRLEWELADEQQRSAVATLGAGFPAEDRRTANTAVHGARLLPIR